MKPILIVISIVFSNLVFGQKQLNFDSSNIESRTFSDRQLNEYRNSKEFRYESIKEPPQSLWDRFWKWFWFKVYEVLATKAGRNTLWILLILFALGMIAFTIMKIKAMNKESLFSRTEGDDLPYSVSADDIHNISFEEAIEDAAAAGNYRLAIRLLYLQTLKRLADKGFIDWKINKTNTDYLKEVSQHSWSSLFSKLTYNFDYSWYGEMLINKERFELVKEDFNTFNTHLQS